ncbi:MAG TPA: HEAT repeat domain-containing protein [Vicinamibacterales bacterium]|jgi:hypothetical protein
MESALAPDVAAQLTAFARACKAAARVFALYPPEHPAIEESLGRLARVATSITEHGVFSMVVLPDNLLVGGRAPARPDSAIAEFARLLHGHLVGELVVGADVDAGSWRIFLGLVGRDPLELRTKGGIVRAWTTAGGYGLELTELDYSSIVRERLSGERASWDVIIARCLRSDALDLDEETLRALTEIAGDPDRLGEFFAQSEQAHPDHDLRARTSGLLRAMRGVKGFFMRHDPGGLDKALDNMAGATSRLSPAFVLDLLAARGATNEEEAQFAAQVTDRITESTVARLVARTVAAEHGGTARLADAFRALVPDAQRRESVARRARVELEASALGSEPDFDQMWSHVEEMLVSYNDAAWVSDSYDQEMTAARARALELEHVRDDPPERISAWLKSVSDVAVRRLDLRLLLDLLAVETDLDRWRELAAIVVTGTDDLVAIGDFAGARQLAEALSAHARDASPRAQPAAAAIETLVAGQMMPQLAFHLNTARDDEFTEIMAMCTAIGPSLIPRLAETLSADGRARARQRMTDLLLAFGADGRHSVDQLRQSPLPSVRRTAVQLLRSFGGHEATVVLEEMLNDADPTVQRDAVRALIAIASDEAFGLLERVLLSDTGRVRAAVAQEMDSTRDHRATPLFCHIVRTCDARGPLREVYLSALSRLGALGGPDAVAVLTEALHMGRWWTPFATREVRTAAAAALGRMKTAAALDALREAATSGGFGVRRIARAYLKE